MVHEQSTSNHHHHHHHHQLLPKYGNGGGNVAGAATGVARASKKNKPKKIPQRGLGVAQLEKLRIEEQKKMEGASMTTATGHSQATLGGGAGGGISHLLPLHPPPPPLPLPRPAADGGVHCGFTPALWDPADPMKVPYRRSLCPRPPLPMVSTGLSLTASSSHPTEPPSNQMYSSSGSRSSAPADEDREAAGVDRSWPLMFEGMSAPTFRTIGKATPPVVPFAARTTREAGLPDFCPDLSRYEFRTANYLSTNPNYSDWTSDFTHSKSSKESGFTGEPAYLTLNAQPAPLMKQPHGLPSIHLPEYTDFGVMQSQPGSISASSSSSRPFYSFLPVGPVRCERSLSEIKADASDGVDLELKL